MNTTSATATTTVWAIDPTHSEISFKVKHMMISTVRGHFDTFSATLESEDETFDHVKAEVVIQTDSINTKNPDRDGHLKSDDFFNAEAFPEIRFESTHCTGTELTGKLTIRDVTKEITLSVTNNGVAVDPYGQTKVGFELSGEISRKEFGLKWNAVTEAGSIVVSDQVQLIIDAQFIRQ